MVAVNRKVIKKEISGFSRDCLKSDNMMAVGSFA